MNIGQLKLSIGLEVEEQLKKRITAIHRLGSVVTLPSLCNFFISVSLSMSYVGNGVLLITCQKVELKVRKKNLSKAL